MLRPRVLLVENEPLQAKWLIHFLLRLNLLPLGPVATAADAIEMCNNEWSELAILDAQLMGTVDEIDLAVQLKRCGNLPVVFLCQDPTDIAMLDRLGGMQPLAILPKSCSAGELQRVIGQGIALNLSAD